MFGISPIKKKEVKINKSFYNNKIKTEDLSIFQEEEQVIKPFGQGIHNEEFYFGKKIGKNIVIITSNRKYYVNNPKNNKKEIESYFGIMSKYPFDDSYIKFRWSNKSIKKWLNGEYKKNISIKEIFEKIKYQNMIYVDHLDERVHDYIALDIISTYYLPIFQTKGRTIIYAPKASGKSTQLNIYLLLGFNAIILTEDTSVSAIIRFIETCNGLPIKDNEDRNSKDKRNSLYNFLEVGYKRGSSILKCTGSNYSLEKFEGFSHFVFANISGIDDDVVISRCNLIEMTRTENKELSRRRLNFRDKIWQDLKDELFISTLQNWKEVQETYSNLDIKEFSGRNFEKINSILTLAKLVSEEIYYKQIDFFKEKEEQNNIIDLENEWLFIATERIFEHFKELSLFSERLQVKEITNMALEKNLILNEEKFNFARYIGKIFTNHNNLFKRGYKGKYRAYTFTRESLIKFAKIHGFEEHLDLTFRKDKSNDTDNTDVEEIDMGGDLN